MTNAIELDRSITLLAGKKDCLTAAYHLRHAAMREEYGKKVEEPEKAECDFTQHPTFFDDCKFWCQALLGAGLVFGFLYGVFSI